MAMTELSESAVRTEAVRLARKAGLGWGLVCGEWLTDRCMIVRLSLAAGRSEFFTLRCGCVGDKTHSLAKCPNPEVDWSCHYHVPRWRQRLPGSLRRFLNACRSRAPAVLRKRSETVSGLKCLRISSGEASVYVQQRYVEAMREAGADAFSLAWLDKYRIHVLVAERDRQIVGVAMPLAHAAGAQ